MNKLYDLIVFHNDTTPALNEDNLNAMSQAINDIDDRVVLLGSDILTVIPHIQAYLDEAEDLVEAMEALSQNPPYIGQNGNWWVWDIEEQAFVDSEIDASISVTIADVTALAPDATPYITNTGTNTDPVFHLFIPRGQTGLPGVSPGIIITPIQGGTRVKITDAAHPQGQSFDILNGSGYGDMLTSVYDSDDEVATAGGIKAYVIGKLPDVSTKYDTTDTEEAALADGDYFPFYDTSANAKRKTLWNNIKAKLKTYFDTLYSTSGWKQGTATVSSGTFAFTGLDDTKGYGYKPYVQVTGASTNKNPTCQISGITGSGTSNMSISYTTDADDGAVVKLRIIK